MWDAIIAAGPVVKRLLTLVQLNAWNLDLDIANMPVLLYDNTAYYVEKSTNQIQCIAFKRNNRWSAVTLMHD